MLLTPLVNQRNQRQTDPDETARDEEFEQTDYHFFIFDLHLDISKFKNEKVHFRKSGVKGLKQLLWLISLRKHAYSNVLKIL